MSDHKFYAMLFIAVFGTVAGGVIGAFIGFQKGRAANDWKTVAEAQHMMLHKLYTRDKELGLATDKEWPGGGLSWEIRK